MKVDDDFIGSICTPLFILFLAPIMVRFGYASSNSNSNLLCKKSDENLKGLFNALELDKNTRKFLFDIVLANIHDLRWGDIEDAM